MSAIKEKLTDTFVGNLSADPAKTIVYQDTAKDGYGLLLRINPGGKKTYFVYGRIKHQKKPKRFTVGDASKIRIDAAREIAQQYHVDMSNGKDPLKEFDVRESKHSVTLRKAFNEYMQGRGVKPNKPNGLEPDTVKDYNAIYRNHLSQWTNTRLIDISGEMVAKHHSSMMQAGKMRVCDKMANLLRMIFNFAMERYRDAQKNPLYAYNPVSALDSGNQWATKGGQARVKGNAIRRKHLQSMWNAINSMLEYVPARRNKSSPLSVLAYYYFKLILFTGLRPGSLAMTEWRQVDLKGGHISFMNEDAQKVKGSVQIFELPLSDYAITLLEEMYAKREKGQRYLFPNAGGTGHVQIGMNEWSKKISLAAEGIDDAMYSSHDYRASFGTVADAVGLNEWAIKRLMNHSVLGSKDVTSGYVRSEIEVLRKQTQLVTNEILRIVGEAPIVSEEIEGFAEDLIMHAVDEVEGTAATVKGVLEKWARLGYLADSMSDKVTVGRLKKMAEMDMS